MLLEHYGKRRRMRRPMDVPQTYNLPGWGMPPKPQGLWVSVRGEDDWPSWCRAEGFRLDNLRHRHIVHLAEDAQIKVVSGRDELIAFDHEWGLDWSIGDIPPELLMRRIDWPKLAEKYDGVVIAPYVWSLRLGEWDRARGHKTEVGRISDWYYPWDCASGCIWNAKAIAAFEYAGGEAP